VCPHRSRGDPKCEFEEQVEQNARNAYYSRRIDQLNGDGSFY